MGIRFYCPDCGRRLNIKAFLAGKRGICPYCDARVQIPLESELPEDAPKFRPSHANESPLASDTALAAATVGTQTERDHGSTRSEAADPIAEAPDAVWYVRPPAGGQYGPAKGDVMQRWLAEGRVSADSMVWREGWPDWQIAGPLFPALQPAALSSGATAGVPVSNGTSSPKPQALESRVSKPEHTSQATTEPRRIGPRRKSIAPLIILGLLIVVLLVVTVVVVTRA